MKSAREYGNMFFRETLYSLLICEIWARDQKEVTNMNKYELAVVVSAKIEDDERAAVVDKCKALVESIWRRWSPPGRTTTPGFCRTTT